MLNRAPLSFRGAPPLDCLWDERPEEQVPARPLSRKSGEKLAFISSSTRSTPRAARGRAVVSVPATNCRTTPVPASSPFCCSILGESQGQSSRPSKGPRQRLLKSHRTSRVTLAEAALSGAEVALWRGSDQQRAIEKVQQDAFEFAKYRRDCKSAWASEDRVRAAQWLKSQLRLTRKQQEQDMADFVGQQAAAPYLDDIQQCSEGVTPRSRTGNSIVLDCTFGRQTSCGRDSVSSSGSYTQRSPKLGSKNPWTAESPSQKRWAACRSSMFVVEATTKLQRGLEEFHDASNVAERRSKIKKQGRMNRLLEARKAQFECLPVGEKERLRRAFNKADKDNSQQLDMSQLRAALAELGISTREPQEKQVLLMMVRDAVACGPVSFLDFVFQVVPKVEHKLSEVKSPYLFKIFNLLDASGTSRIAYADCVEALRRHADGIISSVDEKSQNRFWNTFAQELPNNYKDWKSEDDSVDFAGFQHLAQELEASFSSFKSDLEHRAAIQLNLPPKLEEAHFGEICHLSNIFRVYDHLRLNQIASDYCFLALMDCGALPIAGTVHLRFMAAVEGLASTTMMKFVDFLGFVDSFRKEERVSREAALQSLFTVNGWPFDRKITIAELPQVLIDLNLINDCGFSVNQLRSRVEECNKDAAETFTMHECLDILGKVIELIRTLARQKENKVASELELDTDAVLELRKRFGQMTHSGVIGQHDLRQVIAEINADETIDDLAVKFHLEEALHGEFYDMLDKFKRSEKSAGEVKSASKPPETQNASNAKQAQAQEKAAADEEAAVLRKVLENIVLCFDAYIRVVVHLVFPLAEAG